MSNTHLTQKERYVISHLRCAGFSLREIARRINRHYTTISRELNRNGPELVNSTSKWGAGRAIPCFPKPERSLSSSHSIVNF
jgi:IS30 family transposase